jgi:hypothetical protein
MTGRLDHDRKAYFCSSALRPGKEYCANKRVHEEAILPRIVDATQKVFLNPGNLTRLREELRRQEEEDRAGRGIGYP